MKLPHLILAVVTLTAYPASSGAAGAWLAYPDAGRIVALPLDGGGKPGASSVVEGGGASDYAPALALGDDDFPAAAWLAEDGAVMFGSFDGRAWSAPETVSAARGAHRGIPSLAVAGGVAAVAWAEEAGGGFEDVFYALRSGGRWSAPLRAHGENTVPDILPVARAGSDGALGLSWQSLDGDRYVERSIGSAAPAPGAEALPPDLPGRLLAAGLPVETALAWRGAGGAPASLRLKELLDAEARREEEPRGGEAEGVRELAADEITIIAFGDSITYGRGSSSDGPATGYPAYLAGILLYNYPGQAFKMLNKGNPGEQTGGTDSGLSRIDAVLEKYPADFILIMEGTNDIFFGTSFATIQQNLKQMALHAVTHGVTPVLATVIPTLPYGARSGQYRRARAFYAGGYIQSLAAKYGFACADQWQAFCSVPGWPGVIMDPATGNHPNTNGYRYVMAPRWYEAIAPILGLPFIPSAPQIDLAESVESPARGSVEEFTYTLAPSDDQVLNAVDCYAALLTPQGKLLYFNSSWRLTPAQMPFAQKALLSDAPLSGVLTNIPVPAAAPLGTYTFYLVTVRAMMGLWDTEYWTSNLAEIQFEVVQ